MYNLDFGAAHNVFRAWQTSHPQDPLGFVSDAASYLFSEFDRLHVLQTALFTNDRRFEERSKLPPDPAARAAFNESLSKADQLVAQILAQSPQDHNAMLSQVLANGLRGDYAALIEKRDLASLGYMKNSRQIAERLVAVDPTCYDAYLAVGVENYLLSQNPAPVRWILRLSGAQTDKAEGINHLRMAAEKGHYLGPFARLLLAVAALRDKDRATARALLAGLSQEFPGNHLYSEELAKISPQPVK
ncbi:MAG: hypothetical protein ABSD96_10870 [Candidatus Korobacteraceae bacterium]|jgi:hypothetical protein